MVSAGTVGVLCGALGGLLKTRVPSVYYTLAALIAGVATVYSFAELQGAKLPIPTRHWLVPKEWGQYGQPFFATAFGVILGAGFFTVINFIGYYLLLASCVMTAEPIQGSVVMAVFGAARTAPVLVAPLVSWMRGQTYSFETAVIANDWFIQVDPHMAQLRTGVLLAVAGSAIGSYLG